MNRLFIFPSSLRGWLLLIIIICCRLSAWADDECDFTVNNIHYKFIPNTTNEVAVSYREYESGRYGGYYSNYTGSVTIPAAVTYNSVTYKVTAIGQGAFAERYNLTSVNLPNTITSIGSYAFGDCSQLYSVNIPSSVTSIGSSAFNGCVSLGSISIPNGIISIENYTFANCQSLRSVNIPNSVTSIGFGAFQNCSNLSTISIPTTIESVGDVAFYGTAWLSNLPDGLTYVGKVAYKYSGTMPTNTDITLKAGTLSIAKAAFSGCSGLRSINIPESVTSIGPSAFNGCTSLTAITIPKSVISMGGSGTATSFDGCSALKDVTILCPNVGAEWFINMNSIENVTLGNLVTNISSNAFSGCNGITSITIPKSVTDIDDQAFENCTNLASVSILNSQTSIASTAFNGTPWLENQPDGMIYIDQIAYKYKGTMPEGTQLVIKEGTIEIADAALYSCNNMVSISIPNTVKVIGAAAFHNCTSLSSVNIPNSVTSIGSGAFEGCTSLSSVNIPNSVTSIGSRAFEGCTSLSSVTIPNGITIIESRLFYGCSSLTSISIPNSVNTIGPAAFQNCKGLTSVDIPNSVSSIGFLAFSGCTGLTSVKLSENVSSIDCYTFQGCSGLTSITIPTSVTSISNYAFQDCSITSVTAEGMTPAEVGVYTFSYSYVSYANNLTIYVPTGSKSAYEAAPVWRDCKEIIEIVIPTDISGMTDVVYAQPTSAYRGKNATLPISMKNSESITALQFDLTLPTGVSIAKNTQGKYIVEKTERCADHTLNVSKPGAANVYKVLLYIAPVENITGNEGTVLNVKLETSEEMTEGEYAVTISNINLTTPDETKITPADVTCKLTVHNSIPGDANGDGSIDVTDIVSIANAILGRASSSFDAAAADVNGDGSIDVTDIVVAANMILRGNGQSNAKMRGGDDEEEEDMLDPQ